jgi:hypothetical protein
VSFIVGNISETEDMAEAYLIAVKETTMPGI